MAIYRGPGGAGDATGDATNASALALAAKNEAQASATSAASSATAAANSATAADTSADAASTSATNASGSASTASTAATNASNSAAAADTSADAAASSASDAADSATDAASSAASASTDASTASTQASNASSSASSASTSASTATTKASEASTSATNAASSASTASTAATNASNSASAASTSETNAASSASSASTSASNASTSASTAATQATNAASSASAAATSETNAASSASAASTSASNASTSATNAASSASSAASSAASAAAALDSFDDRYLGSKTSDPTLDNDGNALVIGALYYNSTDGEMRVYDGSQWIAASAASQAILTKYKYVATAGQTTFSGSDANSLTLAYTVGSIIVTLNGVVMDAADYTATTGTSVVLGAAASLNDELCVLSFSTFDVADTYTQAQIDAFAVKLTGDQNIAGAKKFTGSVIVGRVNSGSEGGQIDLCRSSDDASAWAIDVFGSTSTPSLRIVDNTAGATRLEIDGNGTITLNQGQLKFPATQNASSDANTLDDYEEGTWTPSLGGNTTYTTQVGVYTKVGRVVTCEFELHINTIGTGSTTTISGLPFTSNSQTNGKAGSLGYFATIAPGLYSLSIGLDSSSTSLYLGCTLASTTALNTVTAIFQNGTRMRGSITYNAS